MPNRFWCISKNRWSFSPCSWYRNICMLSRTYAWKFSRHFIQSYHGTNLFWLLLVYIAQQLILLCCIVQNDFLISYSSRAYVRNFNKLLILLKIHINLCLLHFVYVAKKLMLHWSSFNHFYVSYTATSIKWNCIKFNM